MMGNMEIPLVGFTILSQAAIGISWINGVRQFNPNESSDRSYKIEWTVAIVLLGIGFIISLFHLSSPFDAIRVFSNLGSAWLSREALMIVIFGALLAVNWLFFKEKQPIMTLITALAGLVLLFAVSNAYAAANIPAFNNGIPFILFLITVLIFGTSISGYFADESSQPILGRLLMITLIVGLVVHILVPSIWLSGGEVLKQTGDNFYNSGLYWFRIIIGFAIPIAVLAKTKTIPSWLIVLFLVGEVIGRILFFSLPVTNSSNIGSMF